ncbi:hypothetical protein [Streptomyces sp. NPDC091416]|uniref:hypothetical protein n=1 Tax=Streptomyces sp. NPDC091416 TaxID=3366003 RepID=UPI0037F97509
MPPRESSSSAAGRSPGTPASTPVRATRSHTVARALAGLDIDRLPAHQVRDKPASAQPEGYALHDTSHPSGVVVSVLGAYGPAWDVLLVRLRAHLEQPSAGYTVEDLEGLAEHEVMVRRANADEQQARRALEPSPSTRAPSASHGEILEATGQESLF